MCLRMRRYFFECTRMYPPRLAKNSVTGLARPGATAHSRYSVTFILPSTHQGYCRVHAYLNPEISLQKPFLPSPPQRNPGPSTP